MKPLERLYNILKLDRKDIIQIFFYAIFSGLVSLSLPLGIQAIINFLQAGRVSASWILLVILVVIGVAFVGVLSLMQLRITENLQQKIFIRSSFEFAFRIPKIKFEAFYNQYPPELANRFFDTLTLQKGISKLLIDFTAALLQIIFGLLLLSLYHSFFILFGILLVFLLYIIFKFSYQKGLDTSLNESKYKYKVAAWLQELAKNSTSFKKETHFQFGLTKNDRLVDAYLKHRESHFAVLKRQFSHLIIFKTIITACLLLIGGFLVLHQQMNIGQFVAAEIIILLVINSVEKIILGLETFYDVLTSIEKIGHVTELPIERESDKTNEEVYNAISLHADGVSFSYPNATDAVLENINIVINQGEKILISGDNGSGKTTLMRLLAGHISPTSGNLYINDDTFNKINLNQYRTYIASITQNETLFEGTIYENITFGREVNQNELKEVLQNLHLIPLIKTLPDGLNTMITSDGRRLSSSNAQKIIVARCILSNPKILFLENPTDKMDEATAIQVIDYLTNSKNNWTLIVSSKNKQWQSKLDRELIMKNGVLIQDLKHN
ncbi:ATP-binding cassette domain-containing protein [Flavobacterium sp. 20NA77.7]|uniref:ATP-binding cassette domain-containing protein n=1 Tax=Flavobacterium nakdongensis TaxID=3073563 RepID=A0ABY9RBZ5_9FLAO|nr:ATP-binding cassette domain-containing protein [Flavobacterium sp. 20NA77.7]WMW78189.1 ATP-binding cassette domain-containing protein [Flavobacterium sp. 20NA77.7]